MQIGQTWIIFLTRLIAQYINAASPGSETQSIGSIRGNRLCSMPADQNMKVLGLVLLLTSLTNCFKLYPARTDKADFCENWVKNQGKEIQNRGLSFTSGFSLKRKSSEAPNVLGSAAKELQGFGQERAGFRFRFGRAGRPWARVGRSHGRTSAEQSALGRRGGGGGTIGRRTEWLEPERKSGSVENWQQKKINPTNFHQVEKTPV